MKTSSGLVVSIPLTSVCLARFWMRFSISGKLKGGTFARFGKIVFWQITSCTHKNRKTIRECVETYFYGKQVSGLITPAQTCQHEKGSLAGYWRMIAAFLATKQHKKFRHKGREICLATGRRLLLPVITYSYFPQVYQLVWETVQNCYIRGLFEH